MPALRMNQSKDSDWVPADRDETIDAVNDHADKLDANEITIADHGTRLTTAEGKITTVEGKVSTLETESADYESRITTLESDIPISVHNTASDSYPATTSGEVTFMFGIREPNGSESLSDYDLWIKTEDVVLGTLTTTGTGLTRALNWTLAAGTWTGVKIYRATSSDGVKTVVQTLAGTAETTDVTLPSEDQSYFYWYTLVRDSYETGFSNAVELRENSVSVTEFEATADAHVLGSDSGNYGSANPFLVKFDSNVAQPQLTKRAMLKFDLGANSLTTATLRLRAMTLSGDSGKFPLEIEVFDMQTTDWVEGEVSWNNKSTGVAWTIDDEYDNVNSPKVGDYSIANIALPADVSTTITFGAAKTGVISLGLKASPVGSLTSIQGEFTSSEGSPKPILIKLT